MEVATLILASLSTLFASIAAWRAVAAVRLTARLYADDTGVGFCKLLCRWRTRRTGLSALRVRREVVPAAVTELPRRPGQLLGFYSSTTSSATSRPSAMNEWQSRLMGRKTRCAVLEVDPDSGPSRISLLNRDARDGRAIIRAFPCSSRYHWRRNRRLS